MRTDQSISLDGFNARFRDDPDPWGTFSKRDEANKRSAILKTLGAGRAGRLLELASGNGSNSAALCTKCLRLLACEGTASGVMLTRQALIHSACNRDRVRALQLVLPNRFPGGMYDGVVIAELLYYLNGRDMAALARETGARVRRGGRLVLAHHLARFADARQSGNGIHEQFLKDTGARWKKRATMCTRHWHVDGYLRC